MSMRIDSFKQAFRDGGARPTLFEVTGSFPGGVGGAAIDSMKFLVEAASLPASTLGTIELPYRGRQLVMAGDRTFEPWTVTVRNTNSFELRKAFESWHELINGHATNASATDLDDYFQDWTVKQLDRDGNVSETYTLTGCWPETVGEIPLSQTTTDDIERFDVTFRYQYWSHQGVTQR